MKLLASMGVLLVSVQIRAAIPVTDPLNLAQNIASVAAEVNQLGQMARQIEYQINSATRFVGKLKGYKFSDIHGLVNQLRSFRNRARAIG